ncbi:hypothetical protein [Steroidobacter cummioxidans]|uniref:hypothetical protein n=1 Tax=Steroidobacter cummioxidans TaxID=1803913 RepID=UPI000E31EAD5|nr:hypothetical protein [Steroidobacter cummioxidans]
MQESIAVWSDPRVWISIVAATGTMGAVIVALFLRELRAIIRPPKLHVELARENGLPITAHLIPPGQVVPAELAPEKSRYYHLKVSNPRRKADAVNGVSVTLLHVERRGQDGQYHSTWKGDVPMVWRNELPDSNGEKKIVGTWAESDLCSVARDKSLTLHVKIRPNDLQWRYAVDETMPVDLIVTVQARGNEADSDERKLRVFWDGHWEDGDLEMRRHFHVTHLLVNS